MQVVLAGKYTAGKTGCCKMCRKSPISSATRPSIARNEVYRFSFCRKHQRVIALMAAGTAGQRLTRRRCLAGRYRCSLA